jgi:phospholipase C
MTSVREALGAVGQAVSIKEIAHQREASFPVSVRNLVGALPPGRIRQKVISLDFLQRKLDQFFNERVRPLFLININGEKMGASTLSVYFDDPAKGYDKENPMVAKELAEPGEPLTIPGIVFGSHRIRFSDVNSDGLTANVKLGQLVGIEVRLHFESQGEELKVEDFPNIDFDGFNIKLNLEFSSSGGLADAVGWIDEVEEALARAKLRSVSRTAYEASTIFRGGAVKAVAGGGKAEALSALKSKLITQFIITDVSVNVDWLPDGKVASKIESTLNTKIYEALKGEGVRTGLKQMVTRWFVGGDFYVAGVEGNEQALTIQYLIPPGQLEPFPENPQPPLDPGRLANIDHIVVLMMENRSFDHMLGYLSKEGGRDGKKRTDIDGLRGGEKNPYKGRSFPSFPLPDTEFKESPPHSHEPVMNQIDGGKMDGFVAAFAKEREAEGVDPGRIMGYHTVDHVPVYDALASQFLICQRWFAAHPGPTFPNRFYTLTGRLNRDTFGNFQFDNPHGDAFQPVATKTLFDHLSEHGVTWRYFEHRYCFLRLFSRHSTDDSLIVAANDPARGFFASAQAGTLPSVSFIDPNFIDEPDGEDNDDGAPANIGAGQNLIGRVVNAVMQGPKWNKTLLIITYDEHGGFYDHVNPFLFRDKAKPVSGIDHYGVRVPSFVISPWVDQRAVSNVVFDHTSIAKTIARRFMSANPPDMGERMAAANDLSMVLRATPRQDKPSIPVPPLPARDVAFAGKAHSATDSDDFKELMRTMYARHRKSRKS